MAVPREHPRIVTAACPIAARNIEAGDMLQRGKGSAGRGPPRHLARDRLQLRRQVLPDGRTADA
jgi:hypothetical protein